MGASMKAIVLNARVRGFDLEDVEIALRDMNDGYAALEHGSLNRVAVTSFDHQFPSRRTPMRMLTTHY